MQARGKQFRVHVLAAAVAIGVGAPVTAQASAFQLLEQGAQGQGTSFAGTGVNWEDPATAFWNPAGMNRHDQRSATVVASVVDVSFDFSDDGSTLNAGDAGNLTYEQLPGADATESTDGGETAFVPNFYYVHPLSDDLTAGFAVNVPYGLESDYDEEWVGRYHATNSELITINLNPSIAYRLSEHVSLGGGINLQYAEATLGSRLDPSAVGPQFFFQDFNSVRGDPNDDSDVVVEGDNWGAGLNLGVAAEINEQTRLGITYRGHVTHSIDGDVSYNHRNETFEAANEKGNVFVDADAAATIDLPETLTISYSGRPATFGNDVNFMGDLTWTRWSRIDSLDIEFDSKQPDTSESLDFNDTLRLALGAAWDVSDNWILRTGIAYDEAPVDDKATRSPRIPDNDRRWFSVGFGYHPAGSNFEIDAAYSHLRISDTSIERTNEFGDVLRGDYDNSVDIVAVQGAWRF